MRRGIARVRFAPDAAVRAPVSGVQLGIGEGGPVALRLFRLTGTSAVLASALLPAQLIAIRTAAAGTPVHVITGRPQFWQPLLPAGRGGHVVAQTESTPTPGGAFLVIEDRPLQLRTALETHPWQCRLDVRTEWAPTDLASFAYADFVVFGGIPAEFTEMVASSFRLAGQPSARLAQLEPGTVGVLRRGRIEFVALNPTPAEQQLLDQARGATVAPSRA